MEPPSRARRQREAVVAVVEDSLRSGEQVVAVLPFASTPKRPKGPGGKVRTGVYQAARRYRPLVVTNRRLIVLNAFRSPYPRGVLAEFPVDSVHVVDLTAASFGQRRLSLDLPELGVVPFVLGRLDLLELEEFEAAIGGE
jgi:hypothetical protein